MSVLARSIYPTHSLSCGKVPMQSVMHSLVFAARIYENRTSAAFSLAESIAGNWRTTMSF